MPPERSEETKRDMEIAGEILRQLGGSGRLKSMCGANNFIAIKNGVDFRMPSHFAKNGINVVEIVLNPMDTYDVKFKKLGRAPKYEITTVSSHENIYNDMLQELFEHETGLHLILAPRRSETRPQELHSGAPVRHRPETPPRLTR